MAVEPQGNFSIPRSADARQLTSHKPLTTGHLVVLGIETSCDETAVAVVENCTTVRSNVICSQVDLHARFGGVVPEVASRRHLELINLALEEALLAAGVTLDEMDAIAVTHAPGLIGSLLVGVCTAKALCLARGIPLVAVNHLEGHLYANFLQHEPNRDRERAASSLPNRDQPAPIPRGERAALGTIEFPFVCLIVSGGHSDIVLARDHGDYQVLARTRDDAAGEAFDKVARVLELGYPGGPAVDAASEKGNAGAVRFPRANLGDSLDFSFSGLKTAVARFVGGYEKSGRTPLHGGEVSVADIAASFQKAVVDVLVSHTLDAARREGVSTIAVAGGVAANKALRERLRRTAGESGFRLHIPPPIYCTDNAAMIACAGSYAFLRGIRTSLSVDTFADAGW